MASAEDSYILTEEDVACDSGEDFPEIRAARNPDRIAPNPANTFDRTNTKALQTPLIATIKKQLPANVRLLLDEGANVDGYSMSVLKDYASAFSRFKRGFVQAEALVPSELTPITAREIQERSKKTFCRFWLGPGSYHWSFYRGGNGITPIEEACKHSSSEIFEMLLSGAPDISYWTKVEERIPETIESTPSSLSASNPLICVIKNRQMKHLRRLLDLGFNPNSMPMVGPSLSYSPLMATLFCCNPPNWDAFFLLMAHPSIYHDLLTTVTRVHILHFVVSLLSLETLQRVLEHGFSLSSVKPTAVGHTLLHIACLPLQMTHVNIFMESIFDSAREFRQGEFSQGPQYIIFEEGNPRPQPTEFFAAQKELVSLLLAEADDPDGLIAAQDCHGNTALHYLSMYRTINWELLDMLISSSEAAQDTYYGTGNKWVWSAENLVRHGEVADSEITTYKSFWRALHTAEIDKKGRIVPLDE